MRAESADGPGVVLRRAASLEDVVPHGHCQGARSLQLLAILQIKRQRAIHLVHRHLLVVVRNVQHKPHLHLFVQHEFESPSRVHVVCADFGVQPRELRIAIVLRVCGQAHHVAPRSRRIEREDQAAVVRILGEQLHRDIHVVAIQANSLEHPEFCAVAMYAETDPVLIVAGVNVRARESKLPILVMRVGRKFDHTVMILCVRTRSKEQVLRVSLDNDLRMESVVPVGCGEVS
mmetsp:Transcript_47493/g.132420  ORF Transcript_47493/g.132420 Transcript_47493/m.132420 type:complete len:232 (+) Transcript_47493:2065-2760(+)